MSMTGNTQTGKVYAFVQESADIKAVLQQQNVISACAAQHSLTVDEWLTPPYLTADAFCEHDVLLVEKMFRLGRDVRAIISLLQELLSKGVIIYSCNDSLKLGENPTTNAEFVRTLGVLANITDELRSSLTKEALASRKRSGYALGRPKGKKNSSQKLDAKKNQISELLRCGKKEPEICRLLRIPRTSLYYYVKSHPELTEAV